MPSGVWYNGRTPSLLVGASGSRPRPPLALGGRGFLPAKKFTYLLIYFIQFLLPVRTVAEMSCLFRDPLHRTINSDPMGEGGDEVSCQRPDVRLGRSRCRRFGRYGGRFRRDRNGFGSRFGRRRIRELFREAEPSVVLAVVRRARRHKFTRSACPEPFHAAREMSVSHSTIVSELVQVPESTHQRD